MTEPEVNVFIEDTEFTLAELATFIDRARETDGIPHDALVAVKHDAMATPVTYRLITSTAYRSKQ